MHAQLAYERKASVADYGIERAVLGAVHLGCDFDSRNALCGFSLAQRRNSGSWLSPENLEVRR